MGKRSNFDRIERDCYDTTAKAFKPILPFLEPATRFIEPCAGKGDLIGLMHGAGHICTAAYDIEPRAARIRRQDALTLQVSTPGLILTNPPWTREILHPLIDWFTSQRETWLLFDADWMHTVQAAPYLDRCAAIVSIGKIKWIPGTKHASFDNCAWYNFRADHTGGPRFHGRG